MPCKTQLESGHKWYVAWSVNLDSFLCLLWFSAKNLQVHFQVNIIVRFRAVLTTSLRTTTQKSFDSFSVLILLETFFVIPITIYELCRRISYIYMYVPGNQNTLNKLKTFIRFAHYIRLSLYVLHLFHGYIRTGRSFNFKESRCIVVETILTNFYELRRRSFTKNQYESYAIILRVWTVQVENEVKC